MAGCKKGYWHYTAAYQDIKPLAAHGDAPAQDILGLMYEYGQGAPQDDAKAVTWFPKAAIQGIAKAQYNLGAMSANGQGTWSPMPCSTWWRPQATTKPPNGSESSRPR